jgi:hypothetical protein
VRLTPYPTAGPMRSLINIRTIKYEEVYLRAYASVPEARASIGRYIDGFYNARRPIRALTGGRRMRPTSLRANPGCSITRAEIHLAAANRLFKQTEPNRASSPSPAPF